jgi:hypothetical protein
MAQLFSITPAITLRGRKFFGIRGWAGKPTHPPTDGLPHRLLHLGRGLRRGLLSRSARRPTGHPGSIAHDFFVVGTLVIISGGVVSLATATTGFRD